MKPFNLQEAIDGKPVVTRSGCPVRIICTDRKGANRVIALVECSDGTEIIIPYNDEGRLFKNESHNDLMMAPVKKKVFVGVYRSLALEVPLSFTRTAKEAVEADAKTWGKELLAIQEIEYEA